MNVPMGYATAVDLISQAGIDPNTVSRLGVTAQGYFEFQMDSRGRVAIDPSSRTGMTTWKPWPSQQVGSAVYQALNPQ